MHRRKDDPNAPDQQEQKPDEDERPKMPPNEDVKEYTVPDRRPRADDD